MLVLSRKEGEIIKIGDNIVLKVVGIRGNQVRIGVEAPNDLVIIRGELNVEEFQHKPNVKIKTHK